MQYGIRLSQTEMDWKEFTILLSGIMPETPLGQIVSIRSEEDKNMLKHFTKEQHEIRNRWRNKHMRNEIQSLTPSERKEATKNLQNLFAKLFG